MVTPQIPFTLQEASVKGPIGFANQCADALISDAPVAVEDFYVYHSIPSCIANIFYADLIGVFYPRAVNS